MLNLYKTNYNIWITKNKLKDWGIGLGVMIRGS